MTRVSMTYWTSGLGVRAISSPLMHMEGSLSPSQSEATYTERSCPDESVGGPPSAQGALVGVHWLKTLSVGEPRLNVGKEPYAGEGGRGR
jgi:hypothetical protein